MLAELGILGSSDDPTEYFEALAGLGIGHEDLPPLQPLLQYRVRKHFEPGEGPERLAAVLGELSAEDDRFNIEGGSWTNDTPWMRGYEKCASADGACELAAQQALAGPGAPASDPRYQRALFHLLASETSCYRYWGQGIWTDRRACKAASSAA